MKTIKEKIEYLEDFAKKFGVVLEKHGEVGFGRSCVGLLHGDTYVEYNPRSRNDWEYVDGLYDDDLFAPSGVRAYHKHECFAVLVEDDEYNRALEQLYEWVTHIQSKGEVELISYPTGASGMQAIISGVTGYAFRLEK